MLLPLKRLAYKVFLLIRGKLEPGNLFIPFKGEHSDGHRFVEDALKRGASCRSLAEGCLKSTHTSTYITGRRYTYCSAGISEKLSE